jgi:hypothetical protein
LRAAYCQLGPTHFTTRDSSATMCSNCAGGVRRGGQLRCGAVGGGAGSREEGGEGGAEGAQGMRGQGGGTARSTPQAVQRPSAHPDVLGELQRAQPQPHAVPRHRLPGRRQPEQVTLVVDQADEQLHRLVRHAHAPHLLRQRVLRGRGAPGGGGGAGVGWRGARSQCGATGSSAGPAASAAEPAASALQQQVRWLGLGVGVGGRAAARLRAPTLMRSLNLSAASPSAIEVTMPSGLFLASTNERPPHRCSSSPGSLKSSWRWTHTRCMVLPSPMKTICTASLEFWL